MNAAERLELADPLQHLSLCIECNNAKVSAPQLCRGTNYPEHSDRWYEVCLNNIDSARPLCKYLGWRNDIPDGKPPRGAPQTLCPGRLCTKDGGRNAINISCLFGLCEACCADAHELLAGLRSCSVVTHRKAVGQPRSARRRRRGGVAIITAPTDPGPIASAATTATVEDAPLDEAALAQLAPTAATVEVAPLTHVAPATKSLQGTRTSTKTRGSRGSRGGRGSSGGRGASVQGRPHLSSYAISISPCYEQRLAETDIEERQRAEDNSAQKAAEAEQGKTAILTWWPENDGQPVHIQVLAPLYPWFRPGDSEHLIKRFGLASGYYEYFDWANSKWFEGDLTTPRRNIKLCGVLHYRNIGVTCCDDMPVSVTGAVKRAGSELEHQPTKRLRFTPSLVPQTPQSARYSQFLPDNRAFPSTPQSFPSTPQSVNSTTGAIQQWDTPLSKHRSNVGQLTHELSTPSSLVGKLSLNDSAHRLPSLADDDDTFAEVINANCSGTVPSMRPTSPAALPGMAGGRLPSLFGTAALSTDLFEFPPVDFTSGAALDLSPAPRGPSKSGWPWLYFCDMAAGFEAWQRFRGEGTSTATAFALAFPGHTYVRATFSENHIPFKKISRNPAVMQHWKSYGRQSLGLWASFREEWRHKA